MMDDKNVRAHIVSTSKNYTSIVHLLHKNDPRYSSSNSFKVKESVLKVNHVAKKPFRA